MVYKKSPSGFAERTSSFCFYFSFTDSIPCSLWAWFRRVHKHAHHHFRHFTSIEIHFLLFLIYCFYLIFLFKAKKSPCICKGFLYIIDSSIYTNSSPCAFPHIIINCIWLNVEYIFRFLILQMLNIIF